MSASTGGAMRPIDYNSPIPYYHQLADILREEIDEGRWGVNELLPAEGKLIDTFGVSRSVTRKALELLEDEGRVLRIKGKGTLVVQPKFAFEGVKAAGQWFSPKTRTVRLGEVLRAGRVPCGGSLGKVLGLPPREDVWELVFTHTLDGQAVSVSQMYLLIRGTLTVGAPPEFESGGPDLLHQLATRYEVDVVSSQLEVIVSRASHFESEHLSVPVGELIVEVSSLDSSDSRLVGFTRSAIRPESFHLAADLHLKGGTPSTSPLSELLVRSDANRRLT